MPSPTLTPDRRAEVLDRNRIVLNRPGASFTVSGRGTCGRIRVLLGDGTSVGLRMNDSRGSSQVDQGG